MSFAGRIAPSSWRSHREPAAWPAALLLVTALTTPWQSVADDRSEGEGLQEIIVTARKVEENLFLVPMSVQALPGELLDAANLSSLYELQFEVPGLVVTNTGMFGAGIALRGVTDEGGGSLAIAPHFDGVFLGSSNLALARLFDVERIEVLKGPQGTLYGRNATGGSINIVSRRPEERFGTGAEAAFGSFDTARFQGYVNLPSENVDVRLAVTGSNGDGSIRNSVDARRFAEEDYFGLRGSVRVQPADGITVDVMAQRVLDDGASGELWLPHKAYLPDPRDIRLTTVTLANPYLEFTNDIAALDIAYEADTATFHSLSGYARNETRALDDCAGIPDLEGCARGVGPLVHEQWSQEFRLGAGAGTGLDWLLGLYAIRTDGLLDFLFSVPGIAPVPINDYTANSREDAYAAFGHVGVRLGERWGVTGEARYSREKHRVRDAGTGVADNPAGTGAEGSWNDTSWRLGLEFTPHEGALLYASVATGFKSGGVTTERLPDGSFDSYGPEDLLAWELGAKLAPPGRRWTLLASAFDYDFEDLQVRTTAILANRVTSVIDNAAAARIRGLDLASTFRIGARLTLSGSLVWLPTREFVEYTNSVTGDVLSGNVLSRAPEWSAAAAIDYQLTLRGVGDLSMRLDYDYRSAFFFTKENVALNGQAAFGLLNLLVRFDALQGGWYLFATGRNLLDTDYFTQAFIQSSPGYPANYEIGFGLRF